MLTPTAAVRLPVRAKLYIAATGNANNVIALIAPCDTAFPTSSPKEDIYLFDIFFSWLPLSSNLREAA